MARSVTWADGRRSYSWWIVYLSSHSVITVIMVWRLWVCRTVERDPGVDDDHVIVDRLRQTGDARASSVWTWPSPAPRRPVGALNQSTITDPQDAVLSTVDPCYLQNRTAYPQPSALGDASAGSDRASPGANNGIARPKRHAAVPASRRRGDVDEPATRSGEFRPRRDRAAERAHLRVRERAAQGATTAWTARADRPAFWRGED